MPGSSKKINTMLVVKISMALTNAIVQIEASELSIQLTPFPPRSMRTTKLSPVLLHATRSPLSVVTNGTTNEKTRS